MSGVVLHFPRCSCLPRRFGQRRQHIPAWHFLLVVGLELLHLVQFFVHANAILQFPVLTPRCFANHDRTRAEADFRSLQLLANKLAFLRPTKRLCALNREFRRRELAAEEHVSRQAEIRNEAAGAQDLLSKIRDTEAAFGPAAEAASSPSSGAEVDDNSTSSTGRSSTTTSTNKGALLFDLRHRQVRRSASEKNVEDADDSASCGAFAGFTFDEEKVAEHTVAKLNRFAHSKEYEDFVLNWQRQETLLTLTEHPRFFRARSNVVGVDVGRIGRQLYQTVFEQGPQGAAAEQPPATKTKTEPETEYETPEVYYLHAEDEEECNLAGLFAELIRYTQNLLRQNVVRAPSVAQTPIGVLAGSTTDDTGWSGEDVNVARPGSETEAERGQTADGSTGAAGAAASSTTARANLDYARKHLLKPKEPSMKMQPRDVTDHFLPFVKMLPRITVQFLHYVFRTWGDAGFSWRTLMMGAQGWDRHYMLSKDALLREYRFGSEIRRNATSAMWPESSGTKRSGSLNTTTTSSSASSQGSDSVEQVFHVETQTKLERSIIVPERQGDGELSQVTTSLSVPIAAAKPRFVNPYSSTAQWPVFSTLHEMVGRMVGILRDIHEKEADAFSGEVGGATAGGTAGGTLTDEKGEGPKLAHTTERPEQNATASDVCSGGSGSSPEIYTLAADATALRNDSPGGRIHIEVACDKSKTIKNAPHGDASRPGGKQEGSRSPARPSRALRSGKIRPSFYDWIRRRFYDLSFFRNTQEWGGGFFASFFRELRVHVPNQVQELRSRIDREEKIALRIQGAQLEKLKHVDAHFQYDSYDPVTATRVFLHVQGGTTEGAAAEKAEELPELRFRDTIRLGGGHLLYYPDRELEAVAASGAAPAATRGRAADHSAAPGTGQLPDYKGYAPHEYVYDELNGIMRDRGRDVDAIVRKRSRSSETGVPEAEQTGSTATASQQPPVPASGEGGSFSYPDEAAARRKAAASLHDLDFLRQPLSVRTFWELDRVQASFSNMVVLSTNNLFRVPLYGNVFSAEAGEKIRAEIFSKNGGTTTTPGGEGDDRKSAEDYYVTCAALLRIPPQSCGAYFLFLNLLAERVRNAEGGTMGSDLIRSLADMEVLLRRLHNPLKSVLRVYPPANTAVSEVSGRRTSPASRVALFTCGLLSEVEVSQLHAVLESSFPSGTSATATAFTIVAVQPDARLALHEDACFRHPLAAHAMKGLEFAAANFDQVLVVSPLLFGLKDALRKSSRKTLLSSVGREGLNIKPRRRGRRGTAAHMLQQLLQPMAELAAAQRDKMRVVGFPTWWNGPGQQERENLHTRATPEHPSQDMTVGAKRWRWPLRVIRRQYWKVEYRTPPTGSIATLSFGEENKTKMVTRSELERFRLAERAGIKGSGQQGGSGNGGSSAATPTSSSDASTSAEQEDQGLNYPIPEPSSVFYSCFGGHSTSGTRIYDAGYLLKLVRYLQNPLFVPQDGSWLVALDLAAQELEMQEMRSGGASSGDAFDPQTEMRGRPTAFTCYRTARKRAKKAAVLHEKSYLHVAKLDRFLSEVFEVEQATFVEAGEEEALDGKRATAGTTGNAAEPESRKAAAWASLVELAAKVTPDFELPGIASAKETLGAARFQPFAGTSAGPSSSSNRDFADRENIQLFLMQVLTGRQTLSASNFLMRMGMDSVSGTPLLEDLFFHTKVFVPAWERGSGSAPLPTGSVVSAEQVQERDAARRARGRSPQTHCLYRSAKATNLVGKFFSLVQPICVRRAQQNAFAELTGWWRHYQPPPHEPSEAEARMHARQLQQLEATLSSEEVGANMRQQILIHDLREHHNFSLLWKSFALNPFRAGSQHGLFPWTPDLDIELATTADVVSTSVAHEFKQYEIPGRVKVGWSSCMYDVETCLDPEGNAKGKDFFYASLNWFDDNGVDLNADVNWRSVAELLRGRTSSQAPAAIEGEEEEDGEAESDDLEDADEDKDLFVMRLPTPGVPKNADNERDNSDDNYFTVELLGKVGKRDVFDMYGNSKMFSNEGFGAAKYGCEKTFFHNACPPRNCRKESCEFEDDFVHL